MVWVWYGYGCEHGDGCSSSLGVAGRDWVGRAAGWARWLIRCYNDMICPLGGDWDWDWAGKWALPVWNRRDYLSAGWTSRERHCVVEQGSAKTTRQSSRAAEMRRNGCNSVRLNPIQSSPTQPGMPARSSSIRGKFGLAVHLAQLPAERGACATARTVGITHSLGSPWGGGVSAAPSRLA